MNIDFFIKIFKISETNCDFCCYIGVERKEKDVMDQLGLYKNIETGDNLEKLLDVYANSLIGFINSYVKDYNSSEDIMMEVFLQLLLKRPDFDSEQKLKSWLFKVAKNKAINFLKHDRVTTKLSEEVLSDYQSFEDSLYKDNLSKVLLESMGAMKPKYREVIYLSFFEQMSLEEIAKTLDMDVRQVRNVKHRAKQKLSKILQAKNFAFEDFL